MNGKFSSKHLLATLALLIVIWTWSFHPSYWLIITPRYVALVVHSKSGSESYNSDPLIPRNRVNSTRTSLYYKEMLNTKGAVIFKAYSDHHLTDDKISIRSSELEV